MAKHRRTRRAPEASRAHILEAATAVFARLGPDAAGLKAVAHQAGVSHGLITHYFGPFENLVERVLEVRMQGLRDRLIDVLRLDDALDVDRLVRAALEQFLAPETGRLMAWALMSGRMAREDFHPRHALGMKMLVDAAAGATDASRETIEDTLLITWSAIASYSVARDVLWASLGEEHRAAHDERFVAALCKVVARNLASPPVDGLRAEP